MMKCLKWVAIAGAVTAGVLLLIGKDDMRKMMQMRQMSSG